MGENDHYVRRVKGDLTNTTVTADSISSAGTYNWYIYYAAGYNTTVTANSTYSLISHNTAVLTEFDVFNEINANTAYRIGVRPICWTGGVENEGQLYLTDTQYCVAPAPTIKTENEGI